ncbi:MAG: hypothetical protein HYZ14_17205 [Bacteroidetes bacterium]|nr:hypothetical protein [Bacteroidota bacterium]
MCVTALISADQIQTHPEQSSVYICDSTGATKYHLTSNCRGLNACDHKVIKVTKQEAYNKGKKELCGWED